jgi:Cdc6-like AAA superfamily ATPase
MAQAATARRASPRKLRGSTTVEAVARCYGRRVDARLDPLRTLYRLADPDRAAAHALHVERKPSIVARVVAALAAEPCGKHVVCGPRGAGKSAAVREIARELGPTSSVVDLDVDRSGLEAAAVSAIDLLYVVGTRALTRVPADAVAALHEELAAACAGGGTPHLGRVEDALPGVAGFGEVLTAVEGACAPSAGDDPALRRLILCGQTAPVLASSAHGRRMQEAIEEIFDAVRAASGQKRIVVAVDGLDRVAPADARRSAHGLLEATRLLTDLSVAVVATLAVPLGAAGSPAGWSQHVVLGFAPDERATLELALLKRMKAAGLDVDDAVPLTQRIAEESGGDPRHAMMLLRAAALVALAAGRANLGPGDVEAAAPEVREAMALAPRRSGRDHDDGPPAAGPSPDQAA